MEGHRRNRQEGKAIFVGVDLHRFKWHVTVRTEEEEVLQWDYTGSLGRFAAVIGSVSRLFDVQLFSYLSFP